MRFVSDLVVETPYTHLDSRRTMAVDDGIVDEGEIGYILRLCRLFLLVLVRPRHLVVQCWIPLYSACPTNRFAGGCSGPATFLVRYP